MNLTINNMPFKNGPLTVTHFRVDSTHSNPYSVWLQQNKPTTPTTAQWDSLTAAQNLAQVEPQSQINFTGAALVKTMTLPQWGVSLLLINKGTSNVKGPDAACARPASVDIRHEAACALAPDRSGGRFCIFGQAGGSSETTGRCKGQSTLPEA